VCKDPEGQKTKVKSKTKSWSGHSSSLEKLLWSKMELKRWTVIDIRLKRKMGSRLIVSWNRRYLAAQLRSDRWLIQATLSNQQL